MKPRIGISTDLGEGGEKLSLRRDYVRAVERAGGIPLLLPIVESTESQDLLAALDGLLLTGGGDVDPQEYGETPSPHISGLSRERDRTELALAAAALERKLPLFAICRGAQVLNVAGARSLVQDIPTEIESALPHRQKAPRDSVSHRVRLSPGSRLAEIFFPETEVEVNSFHHQAVERLAAGFPASALAEDGVIEAIEQPELSWGIGVQWHPESFAGRGDRFARLFATFVQACRHFGRHHQVGVAQVAARLVAAHQVNSLRDHLEKVDRLGDRGLFRSGVDSQNDLCSHPSRKVGRNVAGHPAVYQEPPPRSTGGNKPGIAQFARSAEIKSPSRTTTGSPVRRSLAYSSALSLGSLVGRQAVPGGPTRAPRDSRSPLPGRRLELNGLLEDA